mmetsp:Transcript_17153/g.38455  ORF Transcript_17153/g.38455 Transcript_17153/m.38455 type:complete len:280 (+) Transcript_17153:63-902(+)
MYCALQQYTVHPRAPAIKKLCGQRNFRLCRRPHTLGCGVGVAVRLNRACTLGLTCPCPLCTRLHASQTLTSAPISMQSPPPLRHVVLYSMLSATTASMPCATPASSGRAATATISIASSAAATLAAATLAATSLAAATLAAATLAAATLAAEEFDGLAAATAGSSLAGISETASSVVVEPFGAEIGRVDAAAAVAFEVDGSRVAAVAALPFRVEGSMVAASAAAIGAGASEAGAPAVTTAVIPVAPAEVAAAPTPTTAASATNSTRGQNEQALHLQRLQ